MGLSHIITYTIISGNIGGAFAINETSGMISLANPVDYETLTPDNNPLAFMVRLFLICVIASLIVCYSPPSACSYR